MNSFRLKKYDDLALDIQDITLNEQQEHIRLQLLEKLGELFDYKDFICPGDEYNMFPDEFMHVVTTILADRCIVINDGVPLICIHVYIRELNAFKVRISNNEETFVDVMTFFIISNLQYNGVFTEKWCEPNAFELNHLGYQGDFNGILNFLYVNQEPEPVTNNNDVVINDAEVAITDYFFEAARDDKIDEMYNPVNDHDIVYKDEILDFPEDQPRECGLCGEKCKYACEKCKYMICDECITNIKVRSGECPACRVYPLVLKKVSEGIETIDEHFYEGFNDKCCENKDETHYGDDHCNDEKHSEDDHSNDETQEKCVEKHSEDEHSKDVSKDETQDKCVEKHSEDEHSKDVSKDETQEKCVEKHSKDVSKDETQEKHSETNINSQEKPLETQTENTNTQRQTQQNTSTPHRTPYDNRDLDLLTEELYNYIYSYADDEDYDDNGVEIVVNHCPIQ